jgi:hypothetical protein
LHAAIEAGELHSDTNVEALADSYATPLQSLSAQARDGIPRKHLLAAVDPAMLLLRAAERP